MLTKFNEFMTKPVCRKDLLIDGIVFNALGAAAIIGVCAGIYCADKKKLKEEEKKEKKQEKPKRRYTFIKQF